MKTAKDRLIFGIKARTEFFEYTQVVTAWNRDFTACVARIALSSNTERVITGKVEHDNKVTFKESIIAY